MIQLNRMNFDYVPFPIGVLDNAVEKEKYEKLVDAFPAPELFQFKKELGNKYSLSELNNRENYFKFVKGNPIWTDFYEYVKSPKFIESVIKTLRDNNLKLGLEACEIKQKTVGQNDSILTKIADRLSGKPYLSSRFEFSMLNADGGYLLPHTDSPTKVITLVQTIVKPGEWDRSYGGGTAINKPLDDKKYFNFLNEQLKFEEVSTLKTVEFEANQCMLFIKTFNSFHSVATVKGPKDKLRRTLTINIEMNNRHSNIY
jgi:hypothetical protein